MSPLRPQWMNEPCAMSSRLQHHQPMTPTRADQGARLKNNHHSTIRRRKECSQDSLEEHSRADDRQDESEQHEQDRQRHAGPQSKCL